MELRARLAALIGTPSSTTTTPTARAAPSVRERLRRLGVEGGEPFIDDTAPPLETLAGARVVGEGDERYLRIDRPLEPDLRDEALDWLRLWDERNVHALSPEPRVWTADAGRALFIDTETTGLGGASTLVFLVAGVYWREGNPWLTQFFLFGPGGEPAMMADLLDFLRGFELLVSFNGRAFDVRALCDRFVMCGLLDGPRLVDEMPHLDLLHPSRRIWRNVLSDCRLVTIEREILRRARGEDVNGEDIPMIYYRYLRTSLTRGVHAVIRHNEWDTVTLAVLGAVLLRMLADPGRHEGNDGYDDASRRTRRAEQTVGLGSLHVARGNADLAEETLRHGLGNATPASRYLARKRLAALHKKQGDVARALPLWRAMIDENVLVEAHPYTEIAKHFEHGLRDGRAALEMVERALAELSVGRRTPHPDEADLQKRKQRLVAALSRRERPGRATSRREPPSC